MSKPGRAYIARYEPHNRVSGEDLCEWLKVWFRNRDGSYVEHSFTTVHYQSTSGFGTMDASTLWYQGCRKGRVYKGAWLPYDTPGVETNGVQTSYTIYTGTGKRQFGAPVEGDRSWIRFPLPSGSWTHCRVWGERHDTDISETVVQEDSGKTTIETEEPIVDNTRKHYRHNKWHRVAANCEYLRVVCNGGDTADDFTLMGIELIDINAEVEPDTPGAVMFSGEYIDGEDPTTAVDVLFYPDTDNNSLSSHELACYNQEHGDPLGTKDLADVPPQFGGASHKGMSESTTTITVDGVAWNPVTDAPTSGSEIVISRTSRVSSDYILRAGEEKIAELDVVFRFRQWQWTIERTLRGTEEATRDIYNLFSVLASPRDIFDHVQFGNSTPQALETSTLQGSIADTKIRMSGGSAGVVFLAEHIAGPSVAGTNSTQTAIAIYNAGPPASWRCYIYAIADDEAGGIVGDHYDELVQGESISWDARYTLVNAEDERLISESTGGTFCRRRRRSLRRGRRRFNACS